MLSVKTLCVATTAVWLKGLGKWSSSGFGALVCFTCVLSAGGKPSIALR
jgi:hypothetical protein